MRFKREYKECLILIDNHQRSNVLNEEEKLQIGLEKCKVLLNSGKYTGALLVIEELIRMCEEKYFPSLIIRAKLMKIEALERSDREIEALGLLDTLEAYLEKHKEISDLERQVFLSDILYYRGSIQWQLGNLDKASRLLEESIKLKKLLDDKESLVIAYNRLGSILSYQGDLDEALNYFKRNLIISQEMGNQYEIFRAYDNIGYTYAIKGEYEIAIECHENAERIAEKGSNKYISAIRKGYIGNCNISLGKYEEALKNMKASLELHQEANSSDYFLSDSLQVIIELLVIADFEHEDVNIYLSMLKALSDNNIDNRTIEHRYTFAKALVLKASDRLLDKMQAQTIFKQIVEGKVILLKNSNKSLLNLAELLIIEFKSTENKKVLQELELLTEKLLKLGEEHKNYSIQVKTLLLNSKLAFLNLKVDEAEEFLEKAKRISEERGLNRLTMTIIEEQESLINKKKKLDEPIGKEKSYEERLEFTGIGDILTRMVKNKLEVIDEYDEIVDSFNLDKLSLITCKFSEIGAEVIATSNLPEGPEFDKYSTYMAVSFMTILGQGREYHEGLFGPLPVPIKGYSSIVFSKIINDRNLKDLRLKGKNFTLFCILYPQEHSLLFYDRKALSKLFDTKLSEIDDLEELSDDFLNDLRKQIYHKVAELITPKELEATLVH